MIAALIVASGTSQRMGGRNKLLLPFKGKTVIEVITSMFLDQKDIEKVILVSSDERVQEAVPPHDKLIISQGGSTRSQSVFNGLQCLSEDDFVLIHDGARPFLDEETLLLCPDKGKREEAFVVATPAVDTVKVVKEGYVKNTLPRESIYLAQTPQGGRVGDFLQALRQGWEGTDDASLLERLAISVSVIEGKPGNRKITYEEDQVWLNENR